MHFEPSHLYHIYNQGNNRQTIFFKRDNYLFFLKKIKTYILPYADIIAWCLMPNHFHLLIRVNQLNAKVECFTGGATKGPTSSKTTNTRTNNFQKSIGISLASYTRAINKQNSTTGSLFRSKTKAEPLCSNNEITKSWSASTKQYNMLKIKKE